jgi:hypothetical protein
MPNGDIVSGSSDGIVRVFSEAEERWADVEELRVSTLPVLTIHIADVRDRMRHRNTKGRFPNRPFLRKPLAGVSNRHVVNF